MANEILCKNYSGEQIECQRCEAGTGPKDQHKPIPGCFYGGSLIFDSLLKIAIVGGQENRWEGKQKTAAREYIRDLYKRMVEAGVKVVISGGCPNGGVDIWAEDMVEFSFKEEITIMVFPPEVNQWEDRHGHKGYRSRNKRIARMCDVLYDLEPKGVRSGGTWTAEVAERLGKEVHYVWFGDDGNVEERTVEKSKEKTKETII